MASNMISKARICLKSLHPFLHQECPTIFTLKSSPKLFSSTRFLCTRDSNSKLGVTQTHKRRNEQTDTAVKNKALRQGREDFSKSVFAAGTAKRTAEKQKRKESLVSRDVEQDEEGPDHRTGKEQPPDRPLPPAEWKKLKESLGNPQRFEVRMMRSMFHSDAKLDIAKSLLTFVAMETGTLSYELLLGYLMLCARCGHDAEVFDVYRIMRGSFPSLDTGASSLFIKSFSRTARWKEAISILHEVKKVFTPSARNYGDVIAGAMLNGDTTTAWSFYDELFEKGLTPHQETWDALFTRAQRHEEDGVEGRKSWAEQQERLLGILLYMRNNQIYPQQSVTTSIKTWFESLTEHKWTGNWTSVTPKGVCRCCGSELESIQLTDDEYQMLRDRVMTDIIQGKDVFNKTTPEELEQFKTFVKSKPAFDVVIDGLNVANINKDKFKLSETLLAVVSELERQGLAVLVLGRKHMLNPSRSWDRRNMALLQQKAHCFFTDNISEDDPFLLYATLHSGNHCRFVSQDLMRDHKACLPDGPTRRLFFKWQRGHQLLVDGFVSAGRRVRFQSIPSYDTIVQTSGDFWHVPYDDTEHRSTYEVPQRWLCLSKQH
ncbi:mitochondrial ribonuclease P catalytic subunit [Cololabis saira]|uniref:mitochondrial ribonuclease P catalytic subunit n=1 Tax=Cololabis saira TaxID=129043 RepID=UPI002AD24C2D|nr:mitochondrial ribonuclease P catalytic subunit [Cololabis saira]